MKFDLLSTKYCHNFLRLDHHILIDLEMKKIKKNKKMKKNEKKNVYYNRQKSVVKVSKYIYNVKKEDWWCGCF